MDKLDVRIAGEPFPHLLFHFVLCCSNWESVTICPSESFESLSQRLQEALWQLREHRTDSLSAAADNLSKREEFTQALRGPAGPLRHERQPYSSGEGSRERRRGAVAPPLQEGRRAGADLAGEPGLRVTGRGK